MDHGSIEGHGWTLYEEIIHVPLLWRLPASERGGSTVAAPVGLIDIAPTLLDYLEIEAPASFTGVNRRATMEGAIGGGHVLSENDRFNIGIRVLRGDRYKLIQTADSGRNSAGVPIVGGFELYDLVEDPSESRNLFDPQEERSQALVALLEAAMSGSGPGNGNPEAELSPEQLELLRSLGYVQ
jgi:arylsulfatase A-like enzyme